MNRSSISLRARFESILRDAEWVSRCGKELDLPIVANERCGTWYVDPIVLAEICYFKSTDGHYAQWAFSQRRLNLHLLPLIEAKGGCIIVDSTHTKTKRFPDALSKTIPIWCCIMNRLLFPDATEEFKWPRLPSENVVSREESQEIMRRVPLFEKYAKVCKTVAVELHGLRIWGSASVLIWPNSAYSSIVRFAPSSSSTAHCAMSGKNHTGLQTPHLTVNIAPLPASWLQTIAIIA